MDVFVVDDYRGTPMSREAQALKWVMASDLMSEPLLPADRPIADVLNSTR
jgi:8-oxo-dGTP diphosphatase